MSIVVWFSRTYEALGLDGARRIQVGAHSSRALLAWCIRQAVHSATFSFWLVTAPFRQHSGTSMATAKLSGGSYR